MVAYYMLCILREYLK